ncbi:hypothetical protein [Paraburkholderia azotifigens]|uniref:hypothetical protein n=1 Tax=Paraburkholderia azotifigens TaxID=2057004 RepID=UPI003CCC511F
MVSYVVSYAFIKFASTNYARLTSGGTYSLGGVAGNVTSNQICSLGADYANGPLCSQS